MDCAPRHISPGEPSGWLTSQSLQARTSARSCQDEEAATSGLLLCPGRRFDRRAVDALLERRELPRIAARSGWGGMRRVLAHEALERRDDGGRLLRCGTRRDDAELRSPVHGLAAAYRAARARTPRLGL